MVFIHFRFSSSFKESLSGTPSFSLLKEILVSTPKVITENFMENLIKYCEMRMKDLRRKKKLFDFNDVIDAKNISYF